ncbi:MAG TPA: hypothetical protein VF532_20290 [Candidatus Angelobacter sp.]
MSGRHYLYSLALIAVAAGVFFFKPFSQEQQAVYDGSKWAYHVVQLDAGQCTAEALSSSLNDSGQLGWELVGYAQAPEETSILVQLAATSYGKTMTPPIADSFTGSLKPAESGCRLVFKRPVR